MSDTIDVTVTNEIINGEAEETIEVVVKNESVVYKVDGDISVTLTEETLNVSVDDAINVIIVDETILVAPDEVLEFKFDEVVIVPGTSTPASYTGQAERAVGGISDGQAFTNADMTVMWDSLIKQEKFPGLSNPYSSFSSTVTGYREVGETIPTITFTTLFNHGSISPQYTALSPYRSGLPNKYNLTGAGVSDAVSTNLSNGQTITNYTVLINGQSWSGSVAYDAGVQPKSSYDNDYDTPLSAGTTSIVSRSITGVYPFYSTTLDIATLTKQSLTSMSSSYVQTNMVAEDGTNKQTSEIPQVWNAITGVQFFNTVSNNWEWLGGSQVNSLFLFSKTASTQTIQGNVVDYWRYVNNGATVGARQLRWYTT